MIASSLDPSTTSALPERLPVTAVFPLALGLGFALALGINHGLVGDLLYTVSLKTGNLGDRPWLLIAEGLCGVFVGGLLLGAGGPTTRHLNGLSLGGLLGLFWALLTCLMVPDHLSVAGMIVVSSLIVGPVSCRLGHALGRWLTPRPDVKRHLLGVDAPYWPLFAILTYFQARFSLVGIFHAMRAVHVPHWALTWDSGPGLVLMIFSALALLLAWAMIYWQYKLPRLPPTNRFGGRYLHTRTLLLALASTGLLYLLERTGSSFLTL